MGPRAAHMPGPQRAPCAWASFAWGPFVICPTLPDLRTVEHGGHTCVVSALVRAEEERKKGCCPHPGPGLVRGRLWIMDEDLTGYGTGLLLQLHP